MNNNNHIPPEDRDAVLAKEYGEMLSGRKSGLEHADPLLDILEKTRLEAERAESEIEVRGQEQGWKQIESVLEGSGKPRQDSGKSRRMRLVSLIPARRRRWVAAALVILAMVTLFLLQRTTDPELQLLADSGDTRSTIELADGSTVVLRPHSMLYQIALTESEHSYALTGEALFDVDPAPDRMFTVEAGPGRVVVAGTRFNLNYRGRETRVYLLDGTVQFETIDRERGITLTPGTAAVIDEQDDLSGPFDFQAEEVTAWMRDRLSFRDRPASSIFTELEHHYDITIEAPSGVSRQRLGGSIALETAGQSLDDLGMVLGGEFVRTGEQTYEFRPEQ